MPILHFIEPYATKVYVDIPEIIPTYLSLYQKYSSFDLSDKIKPIGEIKNCLEEVIVEFDAKNFYGSDANNNMFTVDSMTSILSQQDFDYEPDITYVIGIFEVRIKVLSPSEKSLIRNADNKILQYLLTNNKGDL